MAKLEKIVGDYKKLCKSLGITTNGAIDLDSIKRAKPQIKQSLLESQTNQLSSSKSNEDDDGIESDDSDVDFLGEIPRIGENAKVSLPNQPLLSLSNGTLLNGSLLLGSSPQLILLSNGSNSGQLLLSTDNNTSSQLQLVPSQPVNILGDTLKESLKKKSEQNKKAAKKKADKLQLTTTIEKTNDDQVEGKVEKRPNSNVKSNVEPEKQDVSKSKEPEQEGKKENKKISTESKNVVDDLPKFNLKRYSADSLIEQSKQPSPKKRPSTSVIFKEANLDFESEQLNKSLNNPTTTSSSYMTESLLQTTNAESEVNDTSKKGNPFISGETTGPSNPANSLQQVNANFRFDSIKDSAIEEPKEQEKTLTNLDEGKHRNLYMSNSFELMESYTPTNNMFNEMAENRMTPTAAYGNSSVNNKSFELSFVNQPFGTSNQNNAASNSTASFFASGQPEPSTYPSYFGPNHQAPFPILSTTAASFETFGSSPHKTSNATTLVNSTSVASSVFNSNFMPEFNQSSFYAPADVPSTTESTPSSSSANFTPRRSERKKAATTSTSNASKAATRKTQSKKSTANTAELKNSESSSSSNLFNSKRNFNDNFFLIPDIISPATTSAAGNGANTTNSFAISNVSEPTSTSHFSSRYNLFTSTATDQSSYNRNYEFESFPKSGSGRGQEGVNCGSEDGQIKTYPPFIFRPQNAVPVPSSSSATSSSTTVTASYISKSNYNSSVAPPLYYPPTSSASAGNHVPNFNLSNIFPDITLTPTTTTAAPINSYSYLPTSNVDLITTTALSSKHPTTYSRFSQSNPPESNPTNSQSSFLSKFQMIPKPSTIGVDSLTGSNAADPKTSFYGHHHHHHHSHHPHHQNSGSHSHSNHHYSTHFYPPTQHNFSSATSAGGSNNNLARASGNSSGGSTGQFNCDTDINSGNVNNRTNSTGNYQSSGELQPPFSFPYPPPPPNIQSSEPRMSTVVASDVANSTSFNSHQAFGRNNPSAVAAAAANGNSQNAPPPPPPPPHLSFQIFNLTRTDL